VCGAANVRAGLHVALALPGAVLPGGVEIKQSKIRGQVSMGMICSERELGLGQAHAGILELDETTAVGRPLDELFGCQDVCIEVEVTPNRPDWLSHVGVARELAAWYRRPLRLPGAGRAATLAAEADGWRAVIEQPDACPRYTGRLMRGVHVGLAPLWMRQRLLAIGQRPINAVVDASNYVLHELGHPNHVFDLARLSGHAIVVRGARAGEQLTMLDGTQRDLAPHHLVIADQQRAVALAGIMGGEACEVGDSTADLLIEVACFGPRSIRRTRRELGMSTDASYRFERGVDFHAVPAAAERVAALIQQVAGGHCAATAFEGVGTPPAPRARFFVRAAQVQRVLGVPLAQDSMRDLLERLGIAAAVGARDGQPGIDVVPPTFRSDLVEEVDAIEDLARLHGYQNVPVAARPPMLRPAERTPRERLLRTLREGLAARGYHEVVATSFMEESDPERLRLPEADLRRAAVRVLNPLTADQGQLRTTALPEMLRILDRNRRRGYVGPLRLFQLGRCFLGRGEGPLPQEPEQLVLAWSGPAQVPHATLPARPVDLLDALGEVEGLLADLGIAALRDVVAQEPYHAPGASVGLRGAAGRLGTAGQVLPGVAAAFDLDEPVLCAELPLDALIAALPSERRYRPISPYPPVRRDLSLVVPAGVPYAAVVAVAQEVLGALLESFDLFDVYEGERIAAGARALGVRLVLRSHEGTLKDRKVDATIEVLLQRLRAGHGIELRA
jgi:phenylalanyl-tRNA synthetase beta chain